MRGSFPECSAASSARKICSRNLASGTTASESFDNVHRDELPCARAEHPASATENISAHSTIVFVPHVCIELQCAIAFSRYSNPPSFQIAMNARF
jgi:hypothetical protein